jgi:hypothetical protein
MSDFSKRCFVCCKEIDPDQMEKHKLLNLPVCTDCKGTDREKQAVDEHMEGMAEGFVCGCI